jgi:hypothetical protein
VRYDDCELVIRKDGHTVVRCELLPSHPQKTTGTYEFTESPDYVAESEAVLREGHWGGLTIIDANNQRETTKELHGAREFTLQVRDYANCAKSAGNSK